MEEQDNTDKKVTDLNYLQGLSKGDPVFVKEMIRIFLEENPVEIKMLELGLHQRDFEMIHVSAHKLRSTAPFVGIDKLIAEDVMEIESLSVKSSAEKRIEVKADSPEIQKIEIVTTDIKVFDRIGELFERVKKVCEKAREELLLTPQAF